MRVFIYLYLQSFKRDWMRKQKTVGNNLWKFIDLITVWDRRVYRNLPNSKFIDNNLQTSIYTNSLWGKMLHFFLIVLILNSLPKVALFQPHLQLRLTTGYNYPDNLQKANNIISEMDQEVPHSLPSNSSAEFYSIVTIIVKIQIYKCCLQSALLVWKGKESSLGPLL